jgi:hypothetical protein
MQAQIYYIRGVSRATSNFPSLRALQREAHPVDHAQGLFSSFTILSPRKGQRHTSISIERKLRLICVAPERRSRVSHQTAFKFSSSSTPESLVLSKNNSFHQTSSVCTCNGGRWNCFGDHASSCRLYRDHQGRAWRQEQIQNSSHDLSLHRHRMQCYLCGPRRTAALEIGHVGWH